MDTLKFRIVNLWQYWKETRDLSLLDIDFYDNVIGGFRFVIFNIGIIVTCEIHQSLLQIKKKPSRLIEFLIINKVLRECKKRRK